MVNFGNSQLTCLPIRRKRGREKKKKKVEKGGLGGFCFLHPLLPSASLDVVEPQRSLIPRCRNQSHRISAPLAKANMHDLLVPSPFRNFLGTALFFLALVLNPTQSNPTPSSAHLRQKLSSREEIAPYIPLISISGLDSHPSTLPDARSSRTRRVRCMVAPH
jgi:hypothetical protein